MDIRATHKSEKEQVLRIWLKRIPVESPTLYLFRKETIGPDHEPIAQALVYGRGEGSSAMERTMVLFRINPESDARIMHGEELCVKIQSDDGRYKDIALDILSIE